MGIVQNLTLGPAQLEVTHWESTPLLPSSVNNAIIALGALTFALQLCLVLLFVLRCWRADSRARRPTAAGKLIAPSTSQADISKQPCYAVITSSPAVSAASDEYEYEPSVNSLFAPSIPWDLVQR